jgi:hypothetical protein
MFLLLACLPATPLISVPEKEQSIPVDDSETPTETPEDSEAPAQSPIALVSVAETGKIGTPLVFDGSASYDPEGEALASWLWICSDGSTGSEPTLQLNPLVAGELSCTLEITAASGLMASAIGISLISSLEKASWTVMVYINGDNNLEAYGLMDLNELEQIGSTEAVNLVVQMDRAERYDRSDGDWTGARRYLVVGDGKDSGISSPVLEDIGEVDSGRPEALIEFAKWAVSNYPADHYAFVFWDHGDGWFLQDSGQTKGISWDDQSWHQLSVAEGDVGEVLQGVVDAAGQKLDLVGFDACIMATWEVAMAVAPYAEVMVSSQDYESSFGWSYDDAFGELVADPGMSGAEVGEAVARTFYESGDSTQSVVDLENLELLTMGMDELAAALLASDQGPELWSETVRTGWSYDNVNRDIGGLLEGFAVVEDKEVAQAALDAQSVYEAIVLSNWSKSKKGSGLSIYAPTGRVQGSYMQGPWCAESQWDEFLGEMAQ